MNGKYTFASPYWDRISESAKDLIRHLLIVEPKKRYSSEEILQHPWIKQNTSTEDLTHVLPTLKKTSESSKVKFSFKKICLTKHFFLKFLDKSNGK